MNDQSRPVVIVTGSSRGIGRTTVELLASRGARVVVSSRTEEACDAVAADIRADGGDALVVPCHVGKEEQLEHLLEATLAHYGQLDGLVCNAASNPVFGPSRDVDYAAFELILKNNVYSAQRLAVMAAERMQGGAAIVLVSSIAGLMGSRMIGTYAVSKAAEMQVVRNLALELGSRQIRINGVAPGLIRTDFSKALLENPKMVQRFERQSALGRIGEPDDIASVIAFLLSSDAAYITGQTLVVDGGAIINDPF